MSSDNTPAELEADLTVFTAPDLTGDDFTMTTGLTAHGPDKLAHVEEAEWELRRLLDERERLAMTGKMFDDEIDRLRDRRAEALDPLVGSINRREVRLTQYHRSLNAGLADDDKDFQKTVKTAYGNLRSKAGTSKINIDAMDVGTMHEIAPWLTQPKVLVSDIKAAVSDGRLVVCDDGQLATNDTELTGINLAADEVFSLVAHGGHKVTAKYTDPAGEVHETKVDATVLPGVFHDTTDRSYTV